MTFQPAVQANKVPPAGQKKTGFLTSEVFSLSKFVINSALQLSPGGGQPQIHHLELHCAHSAKVVDLRIKYHIHPAAGVQPQFRPLAGKIDGVQRCPAGLQPQLQVPAPAYLRHGVYLGPLEQKYRPRVARAAGLQQIQRCDCLHGQVLRGDGHVNVQHRGQLRAMTAVRHRPAQGLG